MNKPPYELRIGRIDHRDRVEILYKKENSFKVYIPCEDFERLSKKNRLRPMLENMDDILKFWLGEK
jgi:hypothetical protein